MNLECLSDEELKELYKKTSNKIAMYDSTQNGLKTLLNSGYGATASPNFRYFKTDIAEGITSTGQFIIQHIGKMLTDFFTELTNEEFEWVIASDTDSVYLSLSPVVQKWNSQQKLSKAEIVSKLDEFCENTIQPFIVEKYNEIAKYSNLYENRLAMKREAIADAAIWRAKKNYIIQIWDNEGVRYKEPKIKTMGVEAKRSSTPALIKKKLVECYDILINKTEKDIQKYIKDFRSEYENLDLETIAFPRGVSDIDKWYDGNGGWASGTPIHVKASVVYNNLVVQTKTEHKYQKVTNGTKIKFIYLKQPNKTFNNCIGFVDELPQEFDLHGHIDYNTQFTKSFLDPVKSFTDCIGWKTEPTVDMFSFFGGEPSQEQEKVEVVKPRTKQITKQSSLSEFFN